MSPRPSDGNLAFKKSCAALNAFVEKEKGHKYKAKVFTTKECGNVYMRFNGRCGFCGRPLHVREYHTPHGTRFTFYIPLECNGVVDTDNLILSCPACDKNYRGTREFRQAIPDINTFADSIVVLFKAVKEDLDNPSVESREKVDRLKRFINMQLEDMAKSLRYKPFTDWKAKETIFFTEEFNTLADCLEALSANIQNPDEVEAAKETIVESTKQILGTKKYKILRKNPE